jgi:hypothetical protein
MFIEKQLNYETFSLKTKFLITLKRLADVTQLKESFANKEVEIKYC